MAWNAEARKKAAESRRLSGKINQWTTGEYVLSEETRIKHSISSKGRLHTEETKKIMSDKARMSKHRRLKKNPKEYLALDGTIIKMDSSWEVELAERLDYLSVKWIRPEPIEWFDKNGKSHNYFPDFYLPEHDVFLDPKNSYAFEVQKEKWGCLNEQYSNIIILHSLDEVRKYAPVAQSDRVPDF